MAISTKTKLGAVYGVFGTLIACGAMVACGGDDNTGGTSGAASGTSGAASGTSGAASGTSGAASGTSGAASGASGATSGATGSSGSLDGGADATTTGAGPTDAGTDAKMNGAADAGADAKMNGTGPTDAGADATMIGTGPADTGAPDTSFPDAGFADAGAVIDSGPQMGMGDGSVPDTGSGEPACATNWPTDGGANLIGANFDDAGTTSWNALFGAGTVGSSTFAHCEAPSVELSARSASYSVLAYPLPSGAATYNVALWVAHDLQVDGGGGSLVVSVQGTANCGDEGVQTFNVAFPTVASNTFTFVSGTLTIPSGCDTVSLIIGQGAQDQGLTAPFPDLFVDDVYVGF